MPRTTGPFELLVIREHLLTPDENGITNIISIDRVIPVGSQHRQWLLVCKNRSHHATILQGKRQDEPVVEKIVGHH